MKLFQLHPGIAMLALLLTLAQTPTRAAELSDLLRVDGFDVQTASLGEGPFTVVFESGLTDDLSVWRQVAPAVTKKAKLVLYTRAGLGKSAPRPEVSTLEERTRQLAALLAATHAKPPYILVGHSYGGFLIRSFAARYPDQVAGMVFVDPANEQLEIQLKRIDAEKLAQEQAQMARRVPPSFKAEMDSLQKIFDEGNLRLNGPLPQVPTVVLTSTQQRTNPDLLLWTPAGMSVWRDLHAQFIRQFNQGSHMLTPYSGHYIQRDEPRLVIQAIEAVITDAVDNARRRADQQAYAQLRQSLEQAAALVTLGKLGEADALVRNAIQVSAAKESTVNDLGYHYLGVRKLPLLGELVLRVNAENFPSSFNARDSHGEALLAIGQPAEAKRQFTKALDLAKTSGASPRAIEGIHRNLNKVP